jgi:hypothetical protein
MSQKLRAPKYNTVNRQKRRMDANSPVDKGDILTIDPSLLDDRFEYYWCDINKAGNLQKKQAKDWDIVYDTSGIVVGDDSAEKPVQDGSMVTTDGGALVLMSKKKEWCIQDRQKMEAHLKITEKQIREGAEKGFDKVEE